MNIDNYPAMITMDNGFYSFYKNRNNSNNHKSKKNDSNDVGKPMP